METYLRVECKKRGCLIRKWSSPGQRGVPDDIIIWPDGQVNFVELKTKNGVLSELQKHELNRLTEYAQRCYVLRGKIGIDLYFSGDLAPWR